MGFLGIVRRHRVIDFRLIAKLAVAVARRHDGTLPSEKDAAPPQAPIHEP